MKKYEIFIFTFLCYTSIHSLRTSYSYTKGQIAKDIGIQAKYMGIVDALLLSFLGIGHFLHALYPIKKPVMSLWIAMILCGINYEMIPLTLGIKPLANIYVLCICMSLNGFLQSYTWPNLLMIINSKFSSDKNAALLGFWSANANVGNILGYGVFQALKGGGYSQWQYGLSICAIYATANGVYIGARFKQLRISGAKQVKQQSFVQYGLRDKNLNRSQGQIITSYNSFEQNLIKKQNSQTKSVYSEILIKKAHSMSAISSKSIRTLRQISSKIAKGTIKSVKVVDQPERVTQTPLSVIEVFKDPNIILLTITFSLSKSVIYGIMLWLPLYFKSKEALAQYSGQIPITYDIAAIFGSVGIGYLFKKISNKGLLMIPFMVVLFICFLVLKFQFESVFAYFAVISIVGFSLGGIFNTLSGLVVMELTKKIPQNLKTSSLGFYSALTMAVGNITTALTQILIGFVIGKQNPQGIFIVFMVYAAICLVSLILMAILTILQKGELSRAQIVVVEQVKDDDYDSGGEQVPEKQQQSKEEKLKQGKISIIQNIRQGNIPK